MDQGTILMIIVVVAFGGMMWWQSRNAKKRQAQVRDFRESLEPGTLVVSIGGVIGKVVSVDTKYEEIVIDSDGSLLRFTFNAISKRYERPAFVDDDEETPETTNDDTTDEINDSADTASDDASATAVESAQSNDGKNSADSNVSSSTPADTSLPVVTPEHTADASAAQIPFDAELDNASGKNPSTRS